jgi:hypothetical protein
VAGCCEHDNERGSFVKEGNFLTSWTTTSFSRRTLLRRVSKLITHNKIAYGQDHRPHSYSQEGHEISTEFRDFTHFALSSTGLIRECIQKFPDWADNEIRTIYTRWEATQMVMPAKLTRLTHKIAIHLHLVAESYTICSFRSRRSVRKLLDIPSYFKPNCDSYLPYPPSSLVIHNRPGVARFNADGPKFVVILTNWSVKEFARFQIERFWIRQFTWSRSVLDILFCQGNARNEAEGNKRGVRRG